jgi:carbon-monoxide dehydrogenase medium subunit
MNFRLARPAALVDLNRIKGLAGIEQTAGGGIRIGAMTRQRAAERSPLVSQRAPLLAEAMPWIAHPQIRNRGTIGGSLAHADPAAELPAVMLALEARFVVRSRRGERVVPAAEFFTGILSTALGPDELLTAIELPAPVARSGSAFLEVARRHGDYALVGVAARIELDPDGTCRDARVTLLSVADTPVLATQAGRSLAGRVLDAAAIDHAARAAVQEIDPASDLHASAAYRRHLAAVLVGRALRLAARRAGNRSG